MSDDDKGVSELVERLSEVIQESRDFARVAYGYDFDLARRTSRWTPLGWRSSD